jgi:hypothetical protein
MAEHQSKPETPSSGSGPALRGRRRTYDRPQILSREPLESMAATCTGKGAKAIGGKGNCGTPIKS